MKKLLPIITIGFLILSGIGAVAQIGDSNQIKEFTLLEEDQQSLEFTHTVLAEYGTATWCGYCHYAHTALKNIYASGDFPFYYVSFVRDMNAGVVDPRLFTELNLYGYPTVYFDGGADVYVGGSTGNEAAYRSIIPTTGARDVYDVDINLAVSWLGGTEMKIDIVVKNNEGSTYDGTIRAFITEIESSMNWRDTSGNLYTHALLDYAFKDDGTGTIVSIPAGGTWTDSTTWDGASHGFPSITEDNIRVIAAAYNDEPHPAYAYPPSSNPFTAYYVDDCVGQVPGGGGTSDPPETPSAPTGPSEGIAGIDVTFSAVTTDPNGDDILYQFDWGNGMYSGWYGPETSGVAVEGSYTWIQSGTYDVRVRAKDDNGSSESAWSAPTTITILEGPSLDIAEIQGGLLKVTTTIDNPGEAEATDVSWNLAVNGGFLLLDGGNSGTFASIPAGGSQEISSKPIIGFGKTKIMVTCEMVDGPSDQRQQGATVLLFFISMSPGGGI